MTTSPLHDVIVIGAGLSGLNAALHLEAGGARVQVIEARNQVGGRIQSMLQVGHPQEAGGTYIGAGYQRLAAIIKRSGLELVDVTPMLAFFREQDLVLDGELIRQSDWPEHPRNSFPESRRALMPWAFSRVMAMEENPLPSPGHWSDPKFECHDGSVENWLAGLGLSPSAIGLAYDLNPSFGDNASDISALFLFFRAAFSLAQRKSAPAGVMGYTVRDGMQKIPEAMTQLLQGEVHFNRPVKAITSSSDCVEVRCNDGAIYRGRQVVCSLPPGPLRNVAFDPPLPTNQASALQSLGSQPVTQFYFSHRSSFWEDDGYAPSMYTDGPAGMVAAARNGSDPREITSFTAWVMGPKARQLDLLQEADAARAVLGAIETVRPAAKGQLDYVGCKAWGQDSYAGGAWAYFKPGQISRFASELATPHERIHFCGEHLARSARGMEGAMETGEDVAKDILAACTGCRY